MTTSIQLQRRLTTEVTRLLGAERVKSLHRQSALSSGLSLAHIWAAIIGVFWLGHRCLTLPLGYAIASLLVLSLFMSTRINALNVLVHEGSHYALARSRRLNSLLTNFGAGYWILFDEASYRSLHTRHHRHLNEQSDPDLPLYSLSDRRWRIVVDLLNDLLWVSIAKRALVYYRDARTRKERGRPSNLRHWIAKLAANFLLWAAQMLIAGPLYGTLLYVVLWVVPLLSFYPMIIRVRVITEHFAPEVVQADGPSVFVARTSECGPLEHYLFGAQMDYHFEHHLFPGIPYARLKEMHADLKQRGFFRDGPGLVVAHSLSGGYFRYWWKLLAGDGFFRGAPRTA